MNPVRQHGAKNIRLHLKQTWHTEAYVVSPAMLIVSTELDANICCCYYVQRLLGPKLLIYAPKVIRKVCFLEVLLTF